MGGVDELPVIGLDGLAVNLVGPASIVSEGSNRKRNVRVLCPFEGFACSEPESSDVSHEVDLNRLDKGDEPLSKASTAQSASKRASMMSASLFRSLPRLADGQL